MKHVIDRYEKKHQCSIHAYKSNLNDKVLRAKEMNSKLDQTIKQAKDRFEKKMEAKYAEFNEQIKKYHEKLVIRQENLDWQQYETKMANEKRFLHHLETSKNIKQLDRDKLLQSIEEKQKLAEERVAKQEQDMEQAWKIYNEEEANKRVEREKKMQRNIRKLELKKMKVVEKLARHEE